MVSGSQEIMKFENVLFGNEYGSWTGSSFVAPVDGVYKFSLHLLTHYSSRAYRLRALINDGDDGVADEEDDMLNAYQEDVEAEEMDESFDDGAGTLTNLLIKCLKYTTQP